MADDRLSLDGHHSVLTPEYVEFDFVLAGALSRFLAWCADTAVTIVLSVAVLLLPFFSVWVGLVLGVVGVALYLSRRSRSPEDFRGGDQLVPLGMVATGVILLIGGLAIWFISPELGMAMAFVLYFFVDWGYAIVLEGAWNGQTIGKRMFGLRVIQESGVRVTWLQAFARNLARPVDRLPIFYLVGGLAALFSQSQQRLGDLLAGTIVVKERNLRIPASLSRPDGETSLLTDPDFRARVQKLSAEEETVLLTAALRREELGMEARLSLFSSLSTRLQDEVGFFKPPHLSDEKLVLLVTAALAARRSSPTKPKRRAAPSRPAGSTP